MALHHAAPGEVVRLPALASAAGSTALVKTDQFEAIHLVVQAGSTIPAHRVSGMATLLGLAGRVRLSLGASDVILEPGDWVYLDRDAEHEVAGIEDSALLLTVHF